MNKTNKKLSVIAFYLSEYDMNAVTRLGFRTRTEAIKSISEKIGNGNNYLKLRRDEFDALPDSSSTRKGWRNRPPLKEVQDMATYLHQFSFDELTDIVKSFVDDSEKAIIDEADNSATLNPESFSEDELEHILNFSDPTARIVYSTYNGNKRVYNRSIIVQLKKLYRGCCQICGNNPVAEFEEDISEAHHIEYFSITQNNDSDNIIILCPNHHKLIHKVKPVFDPDKLTFSVGNEDVLFVKLDYHLKRN